MLRRRLALIVTLGLVVLGAAPEADHPLPNLVPLPAFDVHVGQTDDGSGPGLRFSAATANRGHFALDLLAVPADPSLQVADAYQCVAWAAPRSCLSREQVGTFEWHPEHQHLHFEDFAGYDLRRLDEDGEIVWSEDGIAATGGKVSYCLIDYEPDQPAPNELYEEAWPLYYSCFAGAGFQGISPYWRDTYVASLAGQQIPLAGVADGTYALVITADPDDRLHETDEDDNVAVVLVRLRGSAVTVLG